MGSFDPTATSVVIRAFETAWEKVQIEGSVAEDDAHLAREILARQVLLLADSGERDVRRMSAKAVCYLRAQGFGQFGDGPA